jgi:hypothetical protein
MFCDKCGAKTPEDFNFCPKCGHDLNQAHKVVDDVGSENKNEGEINDMLDFSIGENKSEEPSTDDEIPSDSNDPDEDVDENDDAEVEEDDFRESDDQIISGASNISGSKKKRSGGGKVFFWAVFITTLIVSAFWVYNNRYIPVKIKFIGNYGGYKIKCSDGRHFTANGRGEYIYRDTLTLFVNKKLTFDFNLPGAKASGPFNFYYSGRDFQPIDTMYSVRFQRTESDLFIKFNLKPFVPGAFVEIDGKKYKFGSNTLLSIPKIKVKRKTTLTLTGGTENDDTDIVFSTALKVEPGKRTRIDKSYTLVPHYSGSFNFSFSVSDELGKKVSKADVTLGYDDIKDKTDKNGEAKITVDNPKIGTSYSPSISKGLMSSINELASANFDPSKKEHRYIVKLRVQDRISLTVQDQNGNAIKNVIAKTSNGRRGKSDSKGRIVITAKNRGSSTKISLSRPGYIDTDVSVIVQAGDNVISAPVIMQPMNVRIRVVNQLTGSPISDISIKIKGVKGEIYTTSDPFQMLFDLVLGKTYSFTLNDHQKRYLKKTVSHKIISNGQLIDVLLEPKPRYINVHFINASGKNLKGVKTSLKSDRIRYEDSDKSGNVQYKVYADTSYMLEYEYKTLVGSRMIYMEAEFEKNQTIRVTFNTKLTIRASVGSPEIRILDPSSESVLATGNGTLTKSLPFDTYMVECDCAGGRYEELVTLNKATFLLEVDCELPIVKAKGAEAAKNYQKAADIYSSIPVTDKYYCEAQERLFYIKLYEDMLDIPEESGNHAKLVLDNNCQNANNPYFCIDAFPRLLKDGDFDEAKAAVQMGFKNEGKIKPAEKQYLKELLNYYEKEVLQEEAFKSKNLSDDEKCERLNTLFGQWENMKTMVTDQELLDRIDIKQSEVDNQISIMGC